MKKHTQSELFDAKINQGSEARQRNRTPKPNDRRHQSMWSNDQSTLTPEQCSFPGCDRHKKIKGLCKRHYQQQWSTGSPAIRRPNPHAPASERFWRYVSKSDGCWLWTGFRDQDGYGKFRESTKRNVGAHRFSFELHNSPVPDGYIVRHLCNNAACVNPEHLALGDHFDNMQDRVRAGHYPTGERHHAVKFSSELVASVKSASGTYKAIGERFGVSPSQVRNIRRGLQRRTA